MIRLRNFLPTVALLVGAAMLGAPTQARASFEILVFVNGVQQGGNLATGSNTSFGVFNATVGNFNLTLSSQDFNYPGTGSGALESNTTNGSVAIGPYTLATATTVTIVISENGWTAPATAPLLLSTSAGGSISSAGGPMSVSATNQGFVDSSAGDPLPTALPPGGTSTPLANASASLSGTGTNPLVYTPSPSTALAPGGVPFALTQVFSYTFAAGTYVTGDSVDVSGSVTVAPVPAPAGIVLALTGLPCLGLGQWLRRRLKTA